MYAAGVDGTGQKIAVVGQTDIRTSDINQFRSKFNLPAIDLQRVLVAGERNPGVVSGDMEEADLDIQWAGAVARNATIVYVYSNDVFQSAMYAVDQNLAPVLSMSYGLCEQADLLDLPLFQSVAQQANAQGITWLAPAGDAGATDCEDRDALVAQNGFAIDAPSSVPEITAMGGTTIPIRAALTGAPRTPRTAGPRCPIFRSGRGTIPAWAAGWLRPAAAGASTSSGRPGRPDAECRKTAPGTCPIFR